MPALCIVSTALLRVFIKILTSLKTLIAVFFG